MTERLADIGARIQGVRQLSAVVNAMRGIAGARAQQARSHLAAVDRYTATISAAIGAVAPLAVPGAADAEQNGQGALILFCAEQGFAGAFSQRVLDAAKHEPADTKLLLVGTRGASIAAERGLRPSWQLAMPAHSEGIPKLAGWIVDTIAPAITAGQIRRLSAIYATHRPGQSLEATRLDLFPLDEVSQKRSQRPTPLLNLPARLLLPEFATEYIHARLCHAALHAFAAENEARMTAMSSAHGQIERTLGDLRGEERMVRQSEITAEIIELASGEAAAREMLI